MAKVEGEASHSGRKKQTPPHFCHRTIHRTGQRVQVVAGESMVVVMGEGRTLSPELAGSTQTVSTGPLGGGRRREGP